MSAAAGKAGSIPRRRRSQRAVDWLDRGIANGRVPAFLVVIVSGLLLASFLLTDDYRVDAVTVRGVEHGDAREVVDASQLLQLSVFEADVEQTAERIAALSFVESVTVEVSFPGRATVSIIERSPSISVNQDDEAWIMSSNASVIAPGMVEGLPSLRLDGPLDAVTPDLVEAVSAIAAVYGPGAPLVWSEDIGLALELPGNRLVIFGEPSEIETKLVVLGAIEDQIDEAWTHLDLRVPTRPAYR